MPNWGCRFWPKIAIRSPTRGAMRQANNRAKFPPGSCSGRRRRRSSGHSATHVGYAVYCVLPTLLPSPRLPFRLPPSAVRLHPSSLIPHGPRCNFHLISTFEPAILYRSACQISGSSQSRNPAGPAFPEEFADFLPPRESFESRNRAQRFGRHNGNFRHGSNRGNTPAGGNSVGNALRGVPLALERHGGRSLQCYPNGPQIASCPISAWRRFGIAAALQAGLFVPEKEHSLTCRDHPLD